MGKKTGTKKQAYKATHSVTLRKRTKKELALFLTSVMNNYDSALVLYHDREKAKKQIIKSYDDLQAWLYEGDDI